MSETPVTHDAPRHESWTPEGPVAPPPRVDEAAVLDAIKTVYDPEIPVDIYELGLVYAVEIGDDGAVKVEMTLTTPSCPSAQELPSAVEEAVRGVANVTEAKVEIVWDPPWDPSRMSEDAKLALNMY
ncbi:SUF system Fe-S cluster assembly protein [Roseomonas sp. CCTCC AB2023176]|uniref:SUF system Fe-S cluster assembly protein n=1 Tax=Roseomonas sp. CCTCC AB2023176 TaxID=3342640 RepID=UPI0035D61509